MSLKSNLATLAFIAGSAWGQNLSTGIDRANMDLSQKPGNDFFEYAGGGWMKAHPLTPEYARYGQFNALDEMNRERLRSLIEGMAQRTDAPQGSLEQKIGALYRLAMDSTRRNREGYAPIRPILEQISAVRDHRAFIHLTGRLSRRGIGAFFSISCDADLHNAKMNLVQISQGGISLGERDYYLENDEATLKIRDAYRHYATRLFTMTGSTAEEAQRKTDALLAIETRIARASYSATKLRDVESNYHKMSYLALQQDFPAIDWSTVFLLEGIPAVEEVSVNQPEPIHEVEKILTETPLDDLKAYLEFKVIDDAASALSDDFRTASFECYGRALQGQQEDRPRWKRAVSAVDGILGMAVGKLYVEKYFPERSKERMIQLVKNLQQTLGERIDCQTWMSAETKAQAHDKLKHFYVKIGYPDTWRNYDDLIIDEHHSYYENLARATMFETDYYIQKRVNKPVDIHEWLMTPQTINAYYNPTTNEICFPAGILQPPFFNAEADDAANYGAIGVVIGHEMTHGFDDQGAQFDREGNLRNWWTESDKANFKQRTDRMVQFFDKIEVLPGLMANGSLTCGENIADHGGLKIAFQALQTAMRQNPLPKADGFTPEQRFFLSYALLWANNIRPEALRNLTKTDPHSAGRWRVNGALPHIEAWYKAFNIKRGDKLYLAPKQRVDVW